MRLLFDENLAARLVRDLADVFPESAHVDDLGLHGAPDATIWVAARDGGFVLVTKDEDFQRLSVLQGSPPKVVWVRLGNCPTSEIARLLRRHRERIEHFVQDAESTFVALG